MTNSTYQRLPLLLILPIVFLGCGEIDKGSFTNQQICVATIASIMNQDPSIIDVNSFKGEITSLSYIRPDDGKNWAYKCKLDGQNVIWGANDGRWRDGKHDSIVTFSVEGEKINISEKFSDGSGDSDWFNADQLKG
ncbi:hypothetical protein AB4497_00665 [Vibrio cyclitrophicus]